MLETNSILLPNADASVLIANSKIYMNLDGRSHDGDVKLREINGTTSKILGAINGIDTYDNIVINALDILELEVSDENKKMITDLIDKLHEENFIINGEKQDQENKFKTITSNVDFFLIHASVEVTNKCNLLCKHCYMSASSENNDMITFDDFKNITKTLVNEGVFNIELTGGEIFVNKDAEKIIEHAFENFNIIGVLTNGTVPISEKVMQLFEKNKDRLIVSISLDSTKPELHDKFRGKSGSWQLTVNNIKKLVARGITVRIAASIFSENMWEIDKLAALSRELGVKIFSYNFIEDFGRAKSFNKEEAMEKTLDYNNYILDTLEEYKDVIMVVESDSYERATTNCGAGTSSIVIDAKGGVRPCALSPNSFNIGDIYQDEKFNKKLIKTLTNLKSPNTEHGCKKECPHYYKCRGCYMKALNVNKDNNMRCNWLKANNIEFLLEYM